MEPRIRWWPWLITSWGKWIWQHWLEQAHDRKAEMPTLAGSDSSINILDSADQLRFEILLGKLKPLSMVRCRQKIPRGTCTAPGVLRLGQTKPAFNELTAAGEATTADTTASWSAGRAGPSRRRRGRRRTTTATRQLSEDDHCQRRYDRSLQTPPKVTSRLIVPTKPRSPIETPPRFRRSWSAGPRNRRQTICVGSIFCTNGWLESLRPPNRVNAASCGCRGVRTVADGVRHLRSPAASTRGNRYDSRYGYHGAQRPRHAGCR